MKVCMYVAVALMTSLPHVHEQVHDQVYYHDHALVVHLDPASFFLIHEWMVDY